MRGTSPTDTTHAGRWRQVFEILDRALELAPEDRAAYVEHACAGDQALGADVAALLSGGDAPAFLETPAVEFAAPFLQELPADLDPAAAGACTGPYRILREIGHGGMGTVYLAERADHQYEKVVALKLLRGWNAGDERLVRRFVEERQILATLDHPDIARLFDGGVTPDGTASPRGSGPRWSRTRCTHCSMPSSEQSRACASSAGGSSSGTAAATRGSAP